MKKGYKHSGETKRKIGIGNKGKILSKKTRKKISISSKKQKNRSKKFLSSESRKKAAETLRRLFKEGKLKTRKGIKHSEETRKKISESHKGKHLSEETKNKLRIANLGKHSIQNHSFRQGGHPKYQHGYFFSFKNKKDIYYRSSYELAVYKILEMNNKVNFYDVEPFSIQYIDINNIERKYFPDILINYYDCSKELIEIKPNRFLNDPNNICKFDAGRKYANINNMKYTIITESQIKNLKSSMETYFMAFNPWIIDALKERGIVIKDNSFEIEFYKGKIQKVSDLFAAIRQQKHIIEQQKLEQMENVELGVEVSKINDIILSLKNMSMNEFTNKRKNDILKKLNLKIKILERKKNELRIEAHHKLLNICKMLKANNIPAAILASNAYLIRLRKRWLINEKVVDKSTSRLIALEHLKNK